MKVERPRKSNDHESRSTTKVMPAPRSSPLPLDLSLFRPGMRIAVGVSGGADSVALLLTLLADRDKLGLVLSVAHLHHGIRGAEADADAAFVAELAARFELPFHQHRVDTPAEARRHRESLEEAARRLRYAWFRDLIASGAANAVATAHTLDDQAETVLHRILRGAWTEGVSGIYPALAASPSENRPGNRPATILRPMLGVRRSEIEVWLGSLGQPWREDSSNRDDAHTRNRLRHQLLPALAEYNPQIHLHLAQLATLSRDEEAYWQSELARLLPSLLLPGRPVRGGGRATSTQPGEAALALEIERLRAFQPAVQRRLRGCPAARFSLNSADWASAGDVRLRDPQPSLPGTAAGGGTACDRLPRELRLTRCDPGWPTIDARIQPPVPGEVLLRPWLAPSRRSSWPAGPCRRPAHARRGLRPEMLLRYSRAPKRAKEILSAWGYCRGSKPLARRRNRRARFCGCGGRSGGPSAGAAGLVVTVEPS
jgi:tRNA(Ile)-lysidine synthase